MKTKVSLGLHQMNIPQKIQNARLYCTNLTANSASFPNLHPTTVLILQAALALENAYEKAMIGGKSDNIFMHDKERELDALITELAHYIEDLPGCNPGLVTLVGLQVKLHINRAATTFTVMPGENADDAHLRIPAVRGAAYHWQIFKGSTAPSSDDGWQELGISTVASYLVNNLTKEIRYWFRATVISGQKQGTWYDPISIMLV